VTHPILLIVTGDEILPFTQRFFGLAALSNAYRNMEMHNLGCWFEKK